MGRKKIKYKDETITADYILELYEQSKKIKNETNKNKFLQDIKKLVPYIGKRVKLELDE